MEASHERTHLNNGGHLEVLARSSLANIGAIADTAQAHAETNAAQHNEDNGSCGQARGAIVSLHFVCDGDRALRGRGGRKAGDEEVAIVLIVAVGPV